MDDKGTCKNRPLMALKAASARLVLTVPKERGSSNATGTIEVQLARGDVAEDSAIEWNASSSVSWLRLRQLSGSVHTLKPVAAVTIDVNASELNDTMIWDDTSKASINEPHSATITVESSFRGYANDLFIGGTNRLQLVVEASVEARAEVTSEDVRVETYSSRKAVSNDDVVVAGDSLRVSITTKDYNRRNISRADQVIRMQLVCHGISLKRELEMIHYQGNIFRGEIPATWMSVTGDYELQSGSTLLVRFKVQEGSNLFLIVGVGCAVPLGTLLIILVVLVYRHQDRAKELVASFIQFELRTCVEFLCEVVDIVGRCRHDHDLLSMILAHRVSHPDASGDCMSFSGVVRARYKPWAQQLLPPYAVFFGISCVASFISMASKGTFLFDKLRSRSSDSYVALSAEELRIQDALDHNRCRRSVRALRGLRAELAECFARVLVPWTDERWLQVRSTQGVYVLARCAA
jgi:hypothetical protein